MAPDTPSPLSDLSDLASTPDAEIDLGRSAMRIALMAYPSLDVDRQLAELDRLAARAREIANGDDREDLVEALGSVLFAEEGFAGNASSYYDPRNSFLNEVLRRRKGIPITLSVVYIEVGRRLGLEIEGIGFPGHFFVAFRRDTGSEFIDPFNGGRTLDGEGLHRLLGASGDEIDFDPRLLRPASRREILLRMLNNLKGIYARGGDFVRTAAVLDRILQLAPHRHDDRLERGLVRARLGRTALALRDLETYLRRVPDGEHTERAREAMVEIRRANALLN